MSAFFAFLWPFLFALLSWVVCVLGLRLWHKNSTPSALFYSSINPLKGFFGYGRVRFLFLPYFLLLGALAALLLAWWNPPLPLVKLDSVKWKKELPPLPSEGVAYYLLLDRSGSMNQTSPLTNPPMRKIDLLKQSTSRLIGQPSSAEEGEPLSIDSSSSDLIGMIGFARSAQVLSPLTLDRKRLQEVLAQFQVVQKDDEDGTGIGYAIFKAVQLIAATRELAEQETKEDPTKEQHFHIHNAFIILLTDGFQDPNPLDQGKWLRTMGLEKAAEYAQKEKVKLYIINMEPSLAQETFAPHRRLLESVAKQTEGEFFLLSSQTSLDTLYASIRDREHTELPLGFVNLKEPQTPQARGQSPLVPVLLLISLLCLIGAVITLSTSHRMVP